MIDQTNCIFALDIGTRTVSGMVITDAEPPKILAAEMMEHSQRAMEDGQVHDVEAVARLVIKLKERLEEQVGFALNSAAVAAAGRSLLTYTAQVSKDIRGWGEISRDDSNSLELEAVQQAQKAIRAEQPVDGVNNRFHCVGYSVNEYLLDGSPIKNLVGHRGNQAACTVTATFLPEVVVDALYAVLRMAGLEVYSMTLEPIAASTVVIPQDLRLLNLALVDMGAGTSDIAISKNGMITAYGMVPLAGDEVSESLEEQFILDFATAERVKRELAACREVSFTDILGQDYHLPADEVTELIRPTVQSIGAKIANEIVALNGGAPPKAVICVGGASQTPGLREVLAESLSLPTNRVAVRYGRDASSLVDGDIAVLSGPDGITPIGIGLSARSRSVLRFQSVEITVDDNPIRLFNLITPTVADALIAANIDPAVVRNKLGMALTAKVNGTFQVVKGSPGQPGKFLLNGQPATLETPLHSGDNLEVNPAVHGEDAKATIADLIPELKEVQVTFNGAGCILRPEIYLNGKKADMKASIIDGADIIYSENFTVRDLLRMRKVSVQPKQALRVRANGRERQIHRNSQEIRVNGQRADLDQRLSSGDVINLDGQAEPLTVHQVLTGAEIQTLSTVEEITVSINGQELTLPGSSSQLLLNGNPASLDAVVDDGDDLQLIPGRKEAHYFAEIFNYIPFDVGARPEGARLVTLKNGTAAEYSTLISDGDELVIRWEEINSVDSEF